MKKPIAQEVEELLALRTTKGLSRLQVAMEIYRLSEGLGVTERSIFRWESREVPTPKRWLRLWRQAVEGLPEKGAVNA